MYEWKSSPQLQAYTVALGHLRVIVYSSSAVDAIDQGRRAMCSDMPRMWDIIQQVEPARFQVTPVGDHSAKPTE